MQGGRGESSSKVGSVEEEKGPFTGRECDQGKKLISLWFAR